MLNPKGGVIDDLIVYLLDQNVYRLVVNASTAEKDLSWLSQLSQTHGLNVHILPRRDLAIIAVQGPQARSLVWQALPECQTNSSNMKPFHAVQCHVCLAQSTFDIFIARTGYTGEDGFELMIPTDQAINVWQALLKVGVKPAGLGARDTLRLEAGMNLYGQDMDEEVSPLDSGLTWTVALNDHRDFVGKAALQAQGQRAQFLGLLLEETGGILRAHQTIHTAHGTGVITSGTFSPSLQRAIALARLPLQVKIGDQVTVEIRNKHLSARVVKYPFVRQGKILVS
jgi:aminomethyltransferase